MEAIYYYLLKFLQFVEVVLVPKMLVGAPTGAEPPGVLGAALLVAHSMGRDAWPRAP
jgi:hypothetical protein